MIKLLKCRTFPKDNIILDYGKEHILITVTYNNNEKKLAVCLNDMDIDNMIKYLQKIRKVK